MKNTLTVPFIIREDLPSERAFAYRHLIVKAVERLRGEHDTTCAEHLMIDRLLNDHNEDYILMAVEQRRELNAAISKAADSDSPDHEVIRQMESVVDGLAKIIGD